MVCTLERLFDCVSHAMPSPWLERSHFQEVEMARMKHEREIIMKEGAIKPIPSD